MPDKYSQFDHVASRNKAANVRSVHPIWRGIGFLLMFIIPIFSWFLSLALLKANFDQNWIPIPRQILVPGGDPLLGLKIGVTILLIILIYSLITFLGVTVFGLFGAPRYGPTDAPPEKRRSTTPRWR